MNIIFSSSPNSDILQAEKIHYWTKDRMWAYMDLKRPVNGVGLLRNRNTIATSRFWAQSLIQKENNLGLFQLNWPHNTYVLYNYYKSL